MNSPLKKPFQLGRLTLPSNIFYAPLAGCSDYPFRKMSSRYKPGLQFCEMVKMDPLVRHDPKTLQLLEYAEEMRPIGAQLCGSKPHLAAPSAKIIEELGFDAIDLNCGCPVDKVTKDGSGSGLLKHPELIGEIVSNIVAAVNLPVTVKIRAGWDESEIVAPKIVEIVEKAGATAICVHGRTREQAYRGPAIWEWIREAKQAASSLLVFGNGDVFSGQAAVKMFEETGCDGIIVSRGTMGQPWIAEDIYRALEGLPEIERSHKERCQALYDHFDFIISHFPERKAVLDMRRVCCWYVKSAHGARLFRDTINKAQSLEEVRQQLEILLNDSPTNF